MIANKATLWGVILVLPFTLANLVVQWKPEPFYSALESVRMLTGKPLPPVILLMLFPVAFVVTISPILKRGIDGRHHFYALNIIWGAIILIATVFLWFGLGQDLIACNILHIPNCD